MPGNGVFIGILYFLSIVMSMARNLFGRKAGGELRRCALNEFPSD